MNTRDIFLISWLRLLAYNRVTQFLTHLPEKYRPLSVVTTARKFLQRPGLPLLQDGCTVVVRLNPFLDQDALQDYLARVNSRPLTIPWLSGLVLRMEIADKPAAQTVPPAQWRKLLSAPT
ncbi:MAG: hypothetical protein GTN71_24625 [Anaerolineae bacterium]|nr:hypothetical protein [Anaerolineae bacterium]